MFGSSPAGNVKRSGMQVQELIQVLKTFPQDAEVVGSNLCSIMVKHLKEKPVIYEVYDDELTGCEKFSSDEEILDDGLFDEDYE
jgi:hypothetical protein